MVSPVELASVIHLAAQPQDCDVHPSRPLVAVGLVTGRVQVYEAAFASTSSHVAASSSSLSSSPPSSSSSPLALNLRASSSSARAVAFSSEGSALYVGDARGTLTAVDVATGKPTARLEGASSSSASASSSSAENAFTRLAAVLSCPKAPSSFCASLPPTSVVSGDESGTVRVWDPRTSEPAFDFLNVHDGEQVSDVLPLPAGAAAGLRSFGSGGGEGGERGGSAGGLVSVGGDGTLVLLDLAKGAAPSSSSSSTSSKKQAKKGSSGAAAVASRSDPDEDELLCVAPARSFSALACGSAGGVLSLWKPRAPGGLAGCADRLPLRKVGGGKGDKGGERPAINSLACLDGSVDSGGGGKGGGGGGGSLLLAGCSDGRLRALSVLPNKVLCELATAHGESREVLRVRTGASSSSTSSSSSSSSSSSLPAVAASVAAPSKALCLWSCEALRESAAAAAASVASGGGGKRARRRRAEEEEEEEDSSNDDESDDDDDESDDSDGDGKKSKKSNSGRRPGGAGSFFEGIV